MSEADLKPRAIATLSYAQAAKAIAASVAYAGQRQLALSFVVLDQGGHLLACARMDGAAFVTVEVARGKAFAVAATGGIPGAMLAKRYEENPMVWGNAGSIGFGAPMLPAKGALPLFIDGQFVGAMGASGAPSDVDEAAVAAGIAAIGAGPAP